MERTAHALDFLASPPAELPPVCVLHGDEWFLKRLVRQQLVASAGGQDVPVERWEGDAASWRDLSDGLCTRSLFGPARRMVIVSDADTFVSQHRLPLEEYVGSPSPAATLVLEVRSWAGNTRLAKSVAARGLSIACRAPERSSGQKKSLDVPRLLAWMEQRARHTHGLRLPRAAAQQLLDLTGPELGLIEQQLAKLALCLEEAEAEAERGVTAAAVVKIVGGWRTQTTWELLDAAADGQAGEALLQLDRLLMSGEHPLGLFGAFSWSLRRFSAAAGYVERAERQGRRASLPEALQAAGFRNFPPGTLQRAEQQLRQLGRERAASLHRWLLETDLQLKGSHSAPERARFAIEQLLLRLAREARPPRHSASNH